MVTNEYIINHESTIKLTPADFLLRYEGTDTFCLFDNEILKDAPNCRYENTHWVLYDDSFLFLEQMIYHMKYGPSTHYKGYIKVLDIYVYDTPSGVEMYESMGQHVYGDKRYCIFKYFNTRTQRHMTRRIVSYNHRYYNRVSNNLLNE